MPTDSASSRRPTNPRTWLEAASSHWASSTRQSSGRSSAVGGQQSEHGKADQEPVGRLAGREAQCDAQRVLLRVRKFVEPGEHRRAELMQRGERQLHFGLDAGDAQDSNTGGLPSAVVQEGRFADARLAAHDKRRALAVADIRQEPIERSAFAGSAQQDRRAARSHGRKPIDQGKGPGFPWLGTASKLATIQLWFRSPTPW